MWRKAKLHGPLQLRKLKEHRGKVALAQVGKAIADVQDKIAQARVGIKDAYALIQVAGEGDAIWQSVHFYPAYVKERQGRIEQWEQRLIDLGREFRQKKQELVRLKSELEVIKKLQEKELKKLNRERQKKIADEIADVIIAQTIWKQGH